MFRIDLQNTKAEGEECYCTVAGIIMVTKQRKYRNGLRYTFEVKAYIFISMRSITFVKIIDSNLDIYYAIRRSVDEPKINVFLLLFEIFKT